MQSLPGLTSPKVQKFLNEICKHAETYLEVGSAFGATAVPAIQGNKLHAYFVDKWEGTIQDAKGLQDFPPLDKDLFVSAIKAAKGENEIDIFHCDMFDVDLSKIKPIDVFFYDADHDKDVTAKAIEYYSQVFSDICIMIIDDANFEGVVEGAMLGLSKTNFKVNYDRMLLNDMENPEAWWNGLYIAVIHREV